MQDVVTQLLRVDIVKTISATRVNGNVKHYNICVTTKDRALTDQLEALWAFGNTSLSLEVFHADYMVRPGELKQFAARLMKIIQKSSWSKS